MKPVSVVVTKQNAPLDGALRISNGRNGGRTGEDVTLLTVTQS
jgi:hypothetical protein